MRIEHQRDDSICGVIKYHYQRNRLDKVIDTIVIAILSIFATIYIVGHILVSCAIEWINNKWDHPIDITHWMPHSQKV